MVNEKYKQQWLDYTNALNRLHLHATREESRQLNIAIDKIKLIIGQISENMVCD